MSLSCSSKNLMAPSSNSTSSEQCYVLLFSALFQFIPTSKYECMHRVSMIFQIILHPALLKCATSTSALSLPVVTSSNTHSVLGRANAKKSILLSLWQHQQLGGLLTCAMSWFFAEARSLKAWKHCNQQKLSQTQQRKFWIFTMEVNKVN